MFLSQNLRYLRDKAGEKQKDIAELLEVSEMTVSRYESGENEPEIKKIIKLAEHFNITIDELLMEHLQMEIPLYLKNLKHLRQTYGMSQKDVGELLGYKGKQEYGAIETGKVKIDIDHLIKLSEYFGVFLDVLINKDLSEGGV